MATTKYLIDTNACIDYFGEALPSKGLSFMDTVIDKGYSISVITRIELYAYSELTTKDKIILDIFTNQANIVNIEDDIIEKTIYLRKKYRTKLPDAIIAATALCSDCTLITNNTKDFKGIAGMKLVNLHE